ncbi:hypothetical protein BsIDN1_54740 [Bacillus safensis]|uniref:Uncharacterized protein n=1 Tax=Bacillus safensis TaxID=561879 RepID=A0A5S9MJQ7_BACIA|nr:hypothetical protein BsIDN1_54740 [Bacillus safensis]
MSKTKHAQPAQTAGEEKKEFGFSFEALKEHSKDLFGSNQKSLKGLFFLSNINQLQKTEAKKKSIDAFFCPRRFKG